MTRLSIPGVTAAQRWTPKLLGSDLKLWLDADDESTFTLSGSAVSEWRDKSGNGPNVAQSDSTRRPTRSTNSINGRAVVDCDGSNDGCLTANNYEMFPTNSTANTFFTVIQFDNVSTQRCFLSWAPSNSGTCGGTVAVELQVGLGGSRSGALSIHRGCDYGASTANSTVTTGTTYILSHHILGTGNSPNNLAFYVNGSSKTVTNHATGWLNAGSYKTGAQVKLAVGSRFDNAGGSGNWDNPTDGRIGEMLLVRAEVSTSDRQKLEGYLAHKWGVTADLPSGHPYKNYAP